MRSIRVEDLLEAGADRLGLQAVAGTRGLERPILSSRIQSFKNLIQRNSARFQVNRPILFGKDDSRAFIGLAATRKKALFYEMPLFEIPCIIVETPDFLDDDLKSYARTAAIPLLVAKRSVRHLKRSLQEILQRLLGSGFHMQGVLMRISEAGVLILGNSGIGKSECALDLITRGHALVADDIVELHQDADGAIIGSPPELIRNHMEVRGLGIINILDLFGTSAVIPENPVDLVVELLHWDQFQHMDRTGLIQRRFTLLDVDLPLFKIPVSLNRNIAIILEVAVKNYHLHRRGIRSAERFESLIDATLHSG